ncbi:MAG: sigma 54-interacting transcriptional regulator [Myxococcota bacterium]|nr:sigma 54-interacting transcriptional regulator [Myxococcota bacterium]
MKDDATIDPVAQSGRGLMVPASRPWVTIVFHPDIRRIGEHAILPDPDLTAEDAPHIVYGRNTPLFERVDGQRSGLHDPCLSRRQFTLRWDRKTETYQLSPHADARRRVIAHTSNGDIIPLDRIPVGSYLNVGDRVCLMLGSRPFVHHASTAPELIGETDVMWSLRARIQVLASTTETALILGPTGSGKEGVASAIHRAGPRRQGPFVSVNCAALATAMVESELFGHRRGAFTGAEKAHQGLFRAAHGGTLFLDEIGEMSLSTQAKMLRVLEEKSVRPVGDTAAYPVDVRVVAATNRNLEEAVARGHFREDLLARLSGLAIRVPPIEARRMDIPLLFFHFLNEQLSKMPVGQSPLWRAADADAPPVPYAFFKQLLAHPWRRNVREILKAAIDTAASNQQAHASQFNTPQLESSYFEPESGQTIQGPVGDVDRRNRHQRPSDIDDETIVRVMSEHDYVQKKAAEALKISRTSLDKRMQAIGLPRPNDLGSQQIHDAIETVGHDAGQLARHLRVSLRGLKLRLTQLNIQLPQPTQPPRRKQSATRKPHDVE